MICLAVQRGRPPLGRRSTPHEKLTPLENTTDAFLETALKLGQQATTPEVDLTQTVFQEVVRAETLIQLKGKLGRSQVASNVVL